MSLQIQVKHNPSMLVCANACKSPNNQVKRYEFIWSKICNKSTHCTVHNASFKTLNLHSVVFCTDRRLSFAFGLLHTQACFLLDIDLFGHIRQIAALLIEINQ